MHGCYDVHGKTEGVELRQKSAGIIWTPQAAPGSRDPVLALPLETGQLLPAGACGPLVALAFLPSLPEGAQRHGLVEVTWLPLQVVHGGVVSLPTYSVETSPYQ